MNTFTLSSLNEFVSNTRSKFKCILNDFSLNYQENIAVEDIIFSNKFDTILRQYTPHVISIISGYDLIRNRQTF